MWKRWTTSSAYFECSHKKNKGKKKKEKKRKRKSNPKPILLAAVSYEDLYSKLCITDWNGKVNLGWVFCDISLQEKHNKCLMIGEQYLDDLLKERAQKKRLEKPFPEEIRIVW